MLQSIIVITLTNKFLLKNIIGFVYIRLIEICITGVSAGGGLSAATAIQCMRNDIPITCTGLVIPMVAPPCTASYQFYSRLSAVLSADIMLWFWRMYCSPQDYTNPLWHHYLSDTY